MAGVREQLFADQTNALKTQDTEKLAILRIATSAVKNVEIDKKQNLTDEETVEVIRRQVKQLQDALKDFSAGGRPDLVEKTEKEIVFLKVYLPAELSRDEVWQIAEKIIKENNFEAKDSGRAMGLIMKELQGRADGNLVREIVNQLLTA